MKTTYTNIQNEETINFYIIEVELAIEKLKRHKATGVDYIPSELVQAGGGKLYEEIHKLIVLIWNKEETF